MNQAIFVIQPEHFIKFGLGGSIITAWLILRLKQILGNNLWLEVQASNLCTESLL